MSGDNSVRKEEIELLPVPRVLTSIYKEDELVTVGVNLLSPASVEVFLKFPKYTRTNTEMDHVSGIQIAGSLFEVAYCAIDNSIRSHYLFPHTLTPEWFLTVAANFIVFKNHIIFRKRLQPEEVVPLKATVLDVGEQRLRKRMLSVTIGYEGFCSGEIVGLIDPPRVVS